MKTMAFIRFLTDGDLGHDLANPFKTAFIQCTECDGTMLLDREKWRADCMKCSHFEHDVPDMIVARSNLDRVKACAAFELSKTTDVFPLSRTHSPENLESMAKSIRCTMTDVKSANSLLMELPLLKEVLLLRDSISESDITSRRIGVMVQDGMGLFIFPKIKMDSMVEGINIISVEDPGFMWSIRRGCDVLQRHIY